MGIDYSKLDVNSADVFGRTRLHYAAIYAPRTEPLESIQRLIEAGADVNAKDGRDRTPLFYAIINDDNRVAQLFIDNNADVNARYDDDQTPLHIAIETGKLETMKCLIDAGADVNAPGDRKRTPLFDAIWKNNLKAVQLLIDNNADVKARGENNQTPLHYAVQTALMCSYPPEKLEIINCLIKAGAEICPAINHQSYRLSEICDNNYFEKKYYDQCMNLL